MKKYPGTKIIQCTLNRQKPVKAAVIIFGDELRVIHDPQLVTENIAAVKLVAGRLELGVVSVYYEGDADLEPYLERTKAVCESLDTTNTILGGDVNAWSHWWGSVSENQRGEDYSSFLNQMEYQILNIGDTPTFEECRRGKLYTSIVDVTACSTPLVGKINNWRVNRTLITSDHNAITFTLELGERLKKAEYPTTRRYNTKKADWLEFRRQLNISLTTNNITVERIQRAQDREDLESIVAAYTTSIEEACESTIPRLGRTKLKSKPPWWTKTLEDLKRDVLRKKRRIKNAAPTRIEHVLQEYHEAKETYAQQTNLAQTESWKEFCSTQERESMWDGIYRVLRKTSGGTEDTLLRGSDGKTLNPAESAKLLANTFYPDDSVHTDKPHHTQLRQLVESGAPEENLSADDPPFTEAEVECVLKAQNPKKAPGPDGFTADICANAIRAEMEVFMAIANKCLAIPHFPRQWKVAHVVILRKPGKSDYTHPKSYRPIGLLSVLGKTVEKLLVGRLQWHLLPTLSPKQYGFMPQRGTEDALYDLVRHVRQELNSKKSVIIVSLDIEGAFDNAWWPALKNQLLTRKCPKNLYHAVCSYLSDRKITVHYAGSSSDRNTTKGCVQGSIGGPTFWNLILDPLLQILAKERVYCQAFADDGVLVFSAKTVVEMEDPINEVLQKIVEWGDQNKLNFAAHKTQAMLLTKKLQFSPPNICMSGVQLALVDEIKLLGLTIDKNLNFNTHVRLLCKKAADIYKQLASAAKVTWGLNGEIIRTIYMAVIEPIVTYGAGAWSEATRLSTNRKCLDALQRGFAQKICKAYRTTSLTSVLVLAGILPLDLRVQEAAALFEAKKGISLDYLPPERHLEERVSYLDLPHPATQQHLGFELLEDMSDATQEAHHIAGPQVYTDGSKMEGKVGAALTWWEDGKEILNNTFSLDPHCTVFQSELYALYRAVSQARDSNRETVNILSDSRSSLELLQSPKLSHPLAKAIKECIAQIRAEGRQVRLFWLRAHVGTPGNERADELAKSASAIVSPQPDYTSVPLSYVKKKIREESVQKWQDRYDSTLTGSVTKVFFPDVATSYGIIRKSKPSPTHVQMMTGHGGFGEYLHRFGLRTSPGCECDPNVVESVWHLLFECPRFSSARFELECSLGAELTKQNIPKILQNNKDRPNFLAYIDTVTRIAAKRNSSLKPEEAALSNSSQLVQVQEHPTRKTPPFNLLNCGERGEPGLRLRGVALFMDNNNERIGIAFCNPMARNNVYLSPGLGLLLNGSNFKISMRRKVYNELPEVTVAGHKCRIVRKNNKTIALFSTDYDVTEFAQACAMLSRLGDQKPEYPARISVDAMVVGYERGDVSDYVGAISASKHHEVVVYEDRGQNLSFLRPPNPAAAGSSAQTDRWDHPIRNPEQSGSERLQERVQQERIQGQGSKNTERTTQTSVVTALSESFRLFSCGTKKKILRMKEATSKIAAAAEVLVRTPRLEATSLQNRTRAEMGQVSPPRYRIVASAQDYLLNALTEFVAVTSATRKVNSDVCEEILQTFRRDNKGAVSEALLQNLLRDAEAAVYDNRTSQVIMGTMSGSYMAAYSMAGGFVGLREEVAEGERPVFNTPPGDPIVVVAKCTRVMLDDRILDMAETVSSGLSEGGIPERWIHPTVSWVQGVPGCGKTSWIVSNINTHTDTVVTTTREAVADLRSRLQPKTGERFAKRRVLTMASLLVNGSRDTQGSRLIVDEALMNHFGAVVMAIQITKANEVVLVGDRNQLPYIDRLNLFPLHYAKPQSINISKQLLCTRRNPQDVAYALSEIYSGIYSANTLSRSLSLQAFKGARIPNNPNTLYLTHTQAEKALLISQGYGKEQNSRTLTIHEAQGLTSESVIIVRTTEKRSNITCSVPHAVVAISRHTKTCVYYTDRRVDDAIARLIIRTENAATAKIWEYNIMMAMRSGDTEVRDLLIEKRNSKAPTHTATTYNMHKCIEHM